MPSTVIQHFSYDSDSRQLTIRFMSGKAYRYVDVPPGVHSDFQLAFAKGVYYNEHIRGKFRYEPIVQNMDNGEG
jgi:hypothetical protein